MEDEDIIVKTSALITIFKIMLKRENAYIDSEVLGLGMSKNYPKILQNVYEDD